MSAVEQLRARTSYVDTEVAELVATAPALSAAQRGQLAVLLRGQR